MLIHSGEAVFGNDNHFPGLFHSLNVSIGISIAVRPDVIINARSIQIPIKPVGFLKNRSQISFVVILLISLLS